MIETKQLNSDFEIFIKDLSNSSHNGKLNEKPWEFHKSLPFYKETPLFKLTELAKEFGLKEIYIKDESNRFGLTSFKSLGAGYALNRVKNEVLQGNKDVICATAGNHGIGVSFFCDYFGIPNTVLIPKDILKTRETILKSRGSKVVRTKYDYDGTVNSMKYDKEYKDLFPIADTTWINYEKIPSLIEIGYSTMFFETLNELVVNGTKDLLIMLQGGVGSFASSCIKFFLSQYGNFANTRFCIVESSKANCLQQSAKENKYTTVKVGNTKAYCIACGEPNYKALETILKNASIYISCCDRIAKLGVNELEKYKIDSTHTGAITTGIVLELMKSQSQNNFKKLLKINNETTILIFNTEKAATLEI